VQEQVQPIFNSLSPPGVNLTFAKLQFGDAPVRIEAVRMDRKRFDGVYLEMDVRWAGEPEVKFKVGVKGCAARSPQPVPLTSCSCNACLPVEHLSGDVADRVSCGHVPRRAQPVPLTSCSCNACLPVEHLSGDMADRVSCGHVPRRA
jgi:hypothetical protein